jgi:hypothetical protein
MPPISRPLALIRDHCDEGVISPHARQRRLRDRADRVIDLKGEGLRGELTSFLVQDIASVSS